MSKEKLKFYIHDPEGLEWKEFNFSDKEENIRALEQLVLKKIEKGDDFIRFDVGDAAIFEEYSMKPPHFSVWFYIDDDGRLMLDFNEVFNRAGKIIKFYNHFAKDMVTFLELCNVIQDCQSDYGNDFEDFIDKWMNNVR